MKEITKLMINKYKIKETGYDFMGYKLSKEDSLTFHHLIIPKRHRGKEIVSNGAIIQRSPHDYLHIIERYDYDLFCAITSEMVDMNIKGYLDIENIKEIDALLEQFEDQYSDYTTKKGKRLIKREYVTNRILQQQK